MLQKSFIGNRNLFSRLMLCLACLLGFQLQSQASESIALSWNASSTGAAGIYIYYGTASHQYSNLVNAGNTNQIVISNLTFGTTYYFAARSYDSSGNESAFSGEVTFTAGSATLFSANLGGNRLAFTIDGTPGQQYILQSSSDLINWTPFLTNTAPYQFTTTPNPTIAQQYFRACRYN